MYFPTKTKKGYMFLVAQYLLDLQLAILITMENFNIDFKVCKMRYFGLLTHQIYLLRMDLKIV